jgi:serine/threonine-protein kinase
MSPERWDRIQALFVEVKDLAPEERVERLGDIADSDPELHSELTSLLSAHDRADELLDRFERLVSQPSFEPSTADDQELSTPDPHGLIGRTVSHYEVVELLGAGGMGVLYKARDTELKRTVALKFLPPQWSLDTAFNRRFRQEARAVAALDHPNVCAIYEVGETEDGQLFIAMAHYEGETVRGKIARGPLDVEDALELATQATSGLAAAHRAGLVHRDIKPANLIVTEEGVLKILDFGLAKSAEASVTEAGLRLGTPAYMSPEQTRGEEVDGRTDLWSLGVVLYEMLTGWRPFRGDSNSAVIHAIRHEEPHQPSELRERLPPGVEQLVLRLLSKEREERHAGAELLSEELALSSATPSGASARQSRFRRRPRWIGFAGLAAAALLLVAVGSLVLGDRGPAASSDPDLVAVLPWTVRGEDPDLEYLKQGLVDLLSISLAELPGFRAVDPYALARFVERSCEAPADPQCGVVVARRFGAGRFLIGAVVPVGGETLQLAASVYDVDGDELSRTTVLGDGREPLVAIEEMGRRIAVELLGPDEAAVDAAVELPAIAARTTTSLTALRAYLQGEAYFRSFRYIDGITVLREAVAADSNFALAWYRLAMLANKAQAFPLADSAAEQALKRMDVLPDRSQKLLRGFDYFRLGKADLAEREFRNLLATHPNDPEAWFLLGETLHHYNNVRGLPPGGYEAFGRALALDPDLAPALWHYRRAALLDGRLEEFDSLNTRYIEQFSKEAENARLAIADSRLVTLLQAEDDSTRERWFADLETASDDDLTQIANGLAGLSWPDRTAGAIRAVRILTDPARSRSARREGYVQLARLAIRAGRWKEANRELDGLATVSPLSAVLLRAQFAASLTFLRLSAAELSEIRADVASILAGSPTYRTVSLPSGASRPASEPRAALLIRLALLSARLGEYEVAREYAAELAAEPVPEGLGLGTIPDDMQLVLRAHILNQEGDLHAARAALDSTRYEARWRQAGDAGTAWTIFLRAEVLYQLGELQEARHWYSLWPTPGGLSTSRYLGAALYRLGQIHDALGEPEEARERFEQFVALWENADPELQPWVEDARARLAFLRG